MAAINSSMPAINEPYVVPTPIQRSEHVQEDAIESTLPTNDEPEVAPTTIHGSKHVKEAAIESSLPTNNEIDVPTPIQESECVHLTEADSVLLSKNKSTQSSRLTRSAHRNLFSNDKDSNETVAFISSQSLRNCAANKKRQCKNK
ncbi:hypothetical protein BDA96_04G132900 [Sorghum bicolor]|uniref:Uncharacterized protein n=1 Tax=Sorghum bicolor TaxID=4558 RepID=A0A921R2I6_SORBI|nr:hypothetical protein BDA96_04G132800 [Sorghum bicolor]KAG0532740.1 hypothetical protein BDA96_04G132900 [Sorghum bicolor]